MRDITRPSIMQNFDAELAGMISKSRGVSLMDGLRIFLRSQTHKMLLDNELRLWYFSPLAIFDRTSAGHYAARLHLDTR